MSNPPSSGHPPVTHYDSYLKKLYFDVLFLALNAAFTQQLSLADEGYESGSNNDLQTPIQKHHAYTTFPVWNMHPSIQLTLCHATQLIHHTTTHN